MFVANCFNQALDIMHKVLENSIQSLSAYTILR